MINPTTDREDPVRSERPRSSWRRILRRSLVPIAVIVVLIYGGVGWYVSGEIIDGALTSKPHVVEYDTEVLSVSTAEIELGIPDVSYVDADRDAVMGLRWDGGYGQLGPAISWTDTTERRPFRLMAGEMPPVGRDVADFDSFAFAPDPSVLGVEYETVTYTSEFGTFDAWFVPGEGSTWIVGVHGQDSDRTEFLRFVDATRELRYPTLIIRYRNSVDSPSTEDHRMLLGQEEWQDLAAAVDYALANGASDVVIYGPSVGGAVTLGYTLHEDRDVIRGLILEAPLADVRMAVAIRSGEALPIGGLIGDSMLAVGRLFASLRTGIDFDEVDYVDRADELDTPILLFHGVHDTKVPYAVGEALAEARPGLIEFHPVPDAYHVRAWNEDPEGFSEIVSAFLGRIGRA